ncbi:unnamed protein product [Dovyalis caffra]|uniref:Uncharacterized protein n=1 Tax=Dovyalis caffra TaxID=77055 RepID=A0AAV1SKI5_9ROSI|nr:unnamed protein product [Dovyalis caffra]
MNKTSIGNGGLSQAVKTRYEQKKLFARVRKFQGLIVFYLIVDATSYGHWQVDKIKDETKVGRHSSNVESHSWPLIGSVIGCGSALAKCTVWGS